VVASSRSPRGASRAFTPAAWLLGSLLVAPSLAAGQGDAKKLSEFQDPAEERTISTSEEAEADAAATAEAPPASLETQAYLRERPDTLGQAARSFHDEALDKLLESREELVEQRRRQAIELLETFIDEEPESAAEMPDALLRLAELRWEQARVRYLDAFAAWQEVPRRNRGPRPRPDYRAAMRLYERLLERHPDFDRLDLVLYMKAFALMERDDVEGALDVYRQIIAEHPNSQFVPDAHFALADSAFNAQDYDKALAQYEEVLDHPESQLADIALFKSAWCLWRMGDAQAAALRFRRVLDLGDRRAEMTGEQRRRLRELQDEALSYLIQVFTEDESNTAADVFDFLEEIGGERYAYEVLERLSDTYMKQARYAEAVEAYELLLGMDASVPEAPTFQLQIAEAYAGMGDEEKTFAALETLASKYTEGSVWARQQGDPQVVERARKTAERAIRRQALEYHEVGQRENQDDELESAARLYRVYLEHFEDEPPAYTIQFYLGEILFHRLERWAEAGDAYLSAARMNPEGELTRDALYNAIGAFERVREAELEECAESPGSDAEEESDTGQGDGDDAQVPARSARAGGSEGGPCRETENDRKFSAAIDLYVRLYPDDPDLPEILFRQGRLYYDRGIYDPAVRLFGQLLAQFPESEYAEPAGELILDSFNRAKDYENIERWARRLKEAPAFQSNEKQKRLDGLILQAMFKVGEQLAKKGDHAKAADAYFRAAEEFPKDERAAKAYYNAGRERQKARDPAGAAEAYDRLIERYPGTDTGALGAWEAAQMYESIAQFRDAAGYYEAYGEQFPKGDRVVDARYNAVLLRLTAGDHEKAVEDGRAFLKAHARHGSADDVYFFVGRAYEASSKLDDAARTYRQYIRRSRNLDRKVEAQTRLAQVFLEADRERAAKRALSQAVRTGKRNQSRLRDGLYYAAQARYLEGELVLDEYEAVTIAGSVDGLRDRLQRKSDLLKEAALIYADVVEFGVAEWVSAALYQIGRSYELFAEAMRDAPVPEDLNAEEEQVYRNELMMFIVPMEERALSAYEGGYDKALEMRVFNRWTAKLREALTRLNDIQYPPLREAGGEIVTATPLPAPEPLEALAPRGNAEPPPGEAKRKEGRP
jgi:TolA-binding protein